MLRRDEDSFDDIHLRRSCALQQRLESIGCAGGANSRYLRSHPPPHCYPEHPPCAGECRQESAWAITKIKKNKEKICSLAKREYICIRFERISQSDTARCGSSVWLECRPVTPEVEGSSPFRTAKTPSNDVRGGFTFQNATKTLLTTFVLYPPISKSTVYSFLKVSKKARV